MERRDRFELRLAQEEARMLHDMAKEAGVSAADFLRQLLRETWRRKMGELNRQKLEMLVIGTLQELTGRPGIRCAVAFTAESGRVQVAGERPRGGPRPTVANSLEVPMVGTVTAEAFSRSLDEAEKRAVEARFPGQVPTWSFAP